ncbi:hypothetical protein [Erythrobacter aureus]|nr:hypothetical protein [Erythrobacter aureus]
MKDLSLFGEIVRRLDEKGYAKGDIEWAENCRAPMHPDAFAREAIFVICNSGMKHTIAQTIFLKCMQALEAGDSAGTVFGHKGKSAAIDKIWAERVELYDAYHISYDKLEYCRNLPWIGGITCYHLAKNFGVDCAKPDVHLNRLADRHATTAHDLCEHISNATGYRINTVDTLLWRACAVGILDGHTAMLIEPKPAKEEPSSEYQDELFPPVQTELFAA